ncbi:MAG: YkgJ family cysteine cluster protein [Candidatus Gastranaerophilales bacterium]|nr:YkgJ family cysteine cluster protein [Candidatus Gastranaerophilales bacterium]
MNKWSKVFSVEYPECNLCAKCCKCAIPSVSYSSLIERFNQADKFAVDFLEMFVPYNTLDEARAASFGTVENVIKNLKNNDDYNEEELKFFCCKHIKDDNRCGIYENRPELCRMYPDTPFLIMHPGCAYEDWAQECKSKYKLFMKELDNFKSIQQEYKKLEKERKQISPEEFITRFNKLQLLDEQSMESLKKSGVDISFDNI